MNIVVDENIPFATEVFGSLGNVRLLPGRMINAEEIRDADILVVRSITRVDEDLLHGSTVQFVGTATAGTDHVDQSYLQSQNILFASAAGANANSVVEYVITSLLLNAQKNGRPLKGSSLGIVGVGNIGAGLAKKASALGLEVLLNDPPKQRRRDAGGGCSLEEVCECDFISLHVPLTYEGDDATFHLFDQNRLASLRSETLLVNTSRGAVVDHAVLLDLLIQRKLAAPVLDVWENEPEINWHLLPRIEIGSPHIAGYAIDGKIKATLMIYEALCAALGTLPSPAIQTLSFPKSDFIQMDAAGRGDLDILADCCTQVYDLHADHERLLALLELPIEKRPPAFDHLRKTYPLRREFQSTSICVKNASPDLIAQIAALGFCIAPKPE